VGTSAKKIVATTAAPAAIGPYSQAVIAGNMLFTSGQIAIDPATNTFLDASIEEQTTRVLENLSAILKAAGATMKDAVKATIFLKDMKDFAAVNGIYAKYFAENPPARSTVEVASLPKGAKIEIELVALLG